MINSRFYGYNMMKWQLLYCCDLFWL